MDSESNHWKNIQRKTFTRWISQRLRKKKLSINDISIDLSDGILLHALMEILSEKSLGKINSKPRIQVQKMENLQKVLRFIEQEESIRLVNIGAGDIHDGNLKLILGLVWALILHYQIGKGFTFSDGDQDTDNAPKYSGKQLLLQYVKNKIPQKNVKNFTTDWSDGTAVAALVDAHAPGLCPDADTMDPANALQNATRAMQLAEDWLGIPQVLAPEDMVNPYVDELSVMTYLSQFPEAVLDPDAPIMNNHKSEIIEACEVVDENVLLVENAISTSQEVDKMKVKVFGSGIHNGDETMIGKPATVIIDCTESGIAPLQVKLLSPNETTQSIELWESSQDQNFFEGSYIPQTSGEYKLEVMFDGNQLSSSPYVINIASEQSKINVSGSGITDYGVNTGEKAIIEVDCVTGCDSDSLRATVKAPSGSERVLSFCARENESSVYESSYVPAESGLYSVTIDIDGQSVSQQSYSVNICNPQLVRVSGCGVTGDGATVGDPALIIVDCTDSGLFPISGTVKFPSGSTEELSFTPSTNSSKIINGSYVPTSIGQHEVTIDVNGRPHPSNPIKVPIKDISKVKVGGSGITDDGARVGKPANVIVDCSDSGVAPVAVKVTDPSGNAEDVKLIPKGPNGFEGFYTPKEPGYYGVEVEFDGKPVPDSPYQVGIGKPESARVSGDGLDKVFVGEDNVIDVFTDGAGPGDISAKFDGPPRARPVVQNVAKMDDNHYQVHFSPQDAGVYDIAIFHNNCQVFQSHCSVSAFDINKVKVLGPAIHSKVEINEETYLDIDLSNSGLINLQLVDVSVEDSNGVQIPHKITEIPNVQLCRVSFTPVSQESCAVRIALAGREIKGSPYLVLTEVSQYSVKDSDHCIVCRGEGLSRAIVNCKAEFEVQRNDNGEPKELKVFIEGPGHVIWSAVDRGNVIKVHYIPSLPGLYKIDASSGTSDAEVIGSPFYVNVENDYNPIHLQGPDWKLPRNRYSIAAPLYIATLVILMGIMDHSV